eukprot:13242742-Alexandrium_andersonii.AAC.1
MCSANLRISTQTCSSACIRRCMRLGEGARSSTGSAFRGGPCVPALTPNNKCSELELPTVHTGLKKLSR